MIPSLLSGFALAGVFYACVYAGTRWERYQQRRRFHELILTALIEDEVRREVAVDRLITDILGPEKEAS